MHRSPRGSSLCSRAAKPKSGRAAKRRTNGDEQTAAARQQRRRCFSRPTLFFQEQIQAPKNGSIARFQGLGCYQSESGFRPAARLWVFGFQWRAPACAVCCASNPMARSEIRLKRQRHFGARIAACRSGLRTLSNRAAKPKSCCANKRQRTNGSGQMAAVAALWISLLALRFQERIQGPKNAPIARFLGFSCYQTRSEFRPAARLAALACCLWFFSGSAPVRVASCFHGPDDKAPEPVHTRCAALGLAPGAPFSEANSRPQNTPHRTV